METVRAVELPAEDPLDLGQLGAGDPPAFQQQVAQRRVLPRRPGRAGLGEPVCVDQVELQRDYAEEQVQPGILARHVIPPPWRVLGGEFRS